MNLEIETSMIAVLNQITGLNDLQKYANTTDEILPTDESFIIVSCADIQKQAGIYNNCNVTFSLVTPSLKSTMEQHQIYSQILYRFLNLSDNIKSVYIGSLTEFSGSFLSQSITQIQDKNWITEIVLKTGITINNN